MNDLTPQIVQDIKAHHNSKVESNRNVLPGKFLRDMCNGNLRHLTVFGLLVNQGGYKRGYKNTVRDIDSNVVTDTQLVNLLYLYHVTYDGRRYAYYYSYELQD